MLDSVTSLSRNGLRDWLIQRITAVIIMVYCVVIIAHILSAGQLSHQFWHDLFHHNAIRVMSVLVVFSIVLHAWIGLWTVYTDYIKWHRWQYLRLFVQIATFIGLMALTAWSFVILWS